MSDNQSCVCVCHNVTGASPVGCNACYQYHQGTVTPRIYPEFPQQPIIDYTPIMLEKLDKIIELLDKLLKK